MTNDQRLKKVEATVDRIEEMIVGMTKPVVWQYDSDYGTDEEKAERIKKLLESVHDNSTIVTVDVPATAGQVKELKAMVEKLLAEVTRPSTFVPSCSIDGKEVVCDGPPVTGDGAGASPEVEPTTTPVVSQPHGKKRKH